MKNSFTDFIRHQHDNIFWGVAEEYINKDFNIADIYVSGLHKIGEYEIADVRIDYIWVEDQPETRVKFDALVNVVLEIHEGDYHYDNSVEKSIALLVTCSGDLNTKLTDLHVIKVVEYGARDKTKKPVDDSLVPYISSVQLEDVATEILDKYYKEALLITERGTPPVWVDPVELADRIGLTIFNTGIEEDASVFGQIYFEETEASLYNITNGTLETVIVPEKTIVVDPRMYFLRNLGSVNNTIVHECVHWLKHRKAFILEKLYNEQISNISCKVVGGALSPMKNDAAAFMEYQANKLAPMIQMPAKPFRAKAVEYTTLYMRQTNARYEIEVMELVIDRLSTDFCVSRQAAKLRLIDLGFNNAIGTFNFVDGHYVKPHGFKKDSIEFNQTFTIGAQDAAFLRFTDKELKEKTANGDYIFIDNHYVYNAPKYVEQVDGDLELTPYALAHMDECCLVFDMKIKGETGTEYHTICYLNREDVGYTFELTYHGGLENNLRGGQEAYRLKELAEAQEIRKQMNDDPIQCLNVVMDFKKISQRELADETGLSTKQIGRIVRGENTPPIETVVLICLGLKLHPILSEKILDAYGYKFLPFNDNHNWMREAINVYYRHSLREIRRLLGPFGLKL